MEKFFAWVGFHTVDGRKAWAFFSMLMGCGVMTLMAAVVLYIVRADVFYAFLLGLAAHAQILVALTGFTAFFVRRDVVITRDSVSVKDLPSEGGNYGSIFSTYEQGVRGAPIGGDSVPRSRRDQGRSGAERDYDRAQRSGDRPDNESGQRDLFEERAEPVQPKRQERGGDSSSR